MFVFTFHTGLRGPVCFSFAALLLWFACAFPLSATELPIIKLYIGTQPITAEVAADDASRSQGLMFRKSLPPDHGMLFVFQQPDQYCFWMKNTLLPLSIAFIDRSGQITNLADMQALSLDTHCAMSPALYALEMEQGWFHSRGIAPGTKIRGLPN